MSQRRQSSREGRAGPVDATSAARYSGPFNDIRGPWRRRVKPAEPESLAVHTGRYRLEGPGEGKQQANRQALERGVWPLSLTADRSRCPYYHQRPVPTAPRVLEGMSSSVLSPSTPDPLWWITPVVTSQGWLHIWQQRYSWIVVDPEAQMDELLVELLITGSHCSQNLHIGGH
ncbi:unnamed protein product [Gadus morhua 'NCC']